MGVTLLNWKQSKAERRTWLDSGWLNILPSSSLSFHFIYSSFSSSWWVSSGISRQTCIETKILAPRGFTGSVRSTTSEQRIKGWTVELISLKRSYLLKSLVKFCLSAWISQSRMPCAVPSILASPDLRYPSSKTTAFTASLRPLSVFRLNGFDLNTTRCSLVRIIGLLTYVGGHWYMKVKDSNYHPPSRGCVSKINYDISSNPFLLRLSNNHLSTKPWRRRPEESHFIYSNPTWSIQASQCNSVYT